MDILGIINLPSYVIYTLVFAFLIYLHKLWKFSYWRKQGVPGPTPWPLIGNLYTLFQKKPIHEIDLENYKKYGKIYGLYEPYKNLLMVADPECLKTILLKDFDKFTNRRDFSSPDDKISSNFLSGVRDEKWHAICNVVSPTFSGFKLRKMSERINESCNDLLACMEQIADKREDFEAKRIFGSYTIDVIAYTAFRTKINSIQNPDNIFVQHAKKVFSPKISLRLLAFFLFPTLAKKLKIPVFEKSAMNFFENVVKKIIKMRKSDSEKGNDFLSMLKYSMDNSATNEDEAEKDKSDNEAKSQPDNEGNETSKKESKPLITEDVVLSQCVLFFLAGYDTTATTLSMTAYNLALNPECQEKLLAEIDECMEKYESLSYDAVNEMKYLNACVKETLRMYSPAIRGEREAGENYKLGDIYLEKGTIIGIPIHSIHHDPEYWPEPDRFNPERFLSEANNIKPFTYLPFGLGRRNCVAERFAMLEVKMALAAVLTKLKFTTCAKTSVPPILKGFGLLVPVDIFLGVDPR